MAGIVSHSINSKNNSLCESKPEASSSFTIKNTPVKETCYLCVYVVFGIFRLYNHNYTLDINKA